MPNLPEKVLAVAYDLLPAGFELTVVPKCASDEEAAELISQAEFFLGFIAKPQPPVVYEALVKTKLVQLISAGYDKVEIDWFRESRVPVATNGGANSVAVAEHTVMLTLAVLKRAADLSNLVKGGGGWHSGGIGKTEVFELEGKTVGLVGLGMIGRQVARRVQAFDARVIYHDVYRLDPQQEQALGVEYVPLDELLSRSDVVSLHVPLTEETRGLMNAQRLAAMKPGAVLVNTCRGEVVDEGALADALRSGHLMGAGLDTLAAEPPPADHPFFSLSNVIITPHTAGPTWDSWRKRFKNGYANIERVSRGEAPQWVIPELRNLLVKAER